MGPKILGRPRPRVHPNFGKAGGLEEETSKYPVCTTGSSGSSGASLPVSASYGVWAVRFRFRLESLLKKHCLFQYRKLAMMVMLGVRGLSVKLLAEIVVSLDSGGIIRVEPEKTIDFCFAFYVLLRGGWVRFIGMSGCVTSSDMLRRICLSKRGFPMAGSFRQEPTTTALSEHRVMNG